jgi:hypothetical protein
MSYEGSASLLRSGAFVCARKFLGNQCVPIRDGINAVIHQSREKLHVA